MANRRIPFLIEKNGSFYWQPSKTAREAGWEPEILGKDEGRAIARSLALNAEYAAWAKGGPAPVPQVREKNGSGTLGEAIALYRRKVVDGTKANGAPKIARSTALFINYTRRNLN